jgi:hypothetical protein
MARTGAGINSTRTCATTTTARRGTGWRALRGEVELLPCAEFALTTSLISEGIYLSDRLNREVTTDEIREQSASRALPCRCRLPRFSELQFAKNFQWKFFANCNFLPARTMH